MRTLGRLFPRQASNDYRGAGVALWVFAGLTGLTVVRSLIHVLAPDGGAASIATIPLATFTANGAAAIIHLFALWGLSQLLAALLYLLVLWRYRNLIPLMYVLLILEYAGRLLLTFTKPFEIEGTAPGAVGNYLILPLAAVMLLLSLRSPDTATNG